MWPDGSSYKGKWLKNLQNGKAVITNIDGTEIRAYFSDGCKIRDLEDNEKVDDDVEEESFANTDRFGIVYDVCKLK